MTANSCKLNKSVYRCLLHPRTYHFHFQARKSPAQLSRAYRWYCSTSKVSIGGEVSSEMRILSGSSLGVTLRHFGARNTHGGGGVLFPFHADSTWRTWWNSSSVLHYQIGTHPRSPVVSGQAWDRRIGPFHAQPHDASLALADEIRWLENT